MPNPRSIKDADLKQSVLYGNVSFTANTNAIDLGQVLPYAVLERVNLRIRTTLGTNAANNKNINIQLQHSDVNLSANFVNVTEIAPIIFIEVGTQYPVQQKDYALPPTIKQFIRLRVTGEANGGNANDGSAIIELLL